MKDLTRGNETSLIFNFALPMLFGSILQQFAQIINAWIVGNYISADAMSAVGASFYIIFALVSLVIGIGIGGTVVVSQLFGAHQLNMVKKASDTVVIFMIVAGALVGIIGIIFTEPLLILTNVPSEIIPDASTFLMLNFCGMAPMFGYHAISSVLRGIGDSLRPLYFLILATLLNLILDFVFVVNFGMGVEGVGYATLIAYFTSFILVVMYMNKYHPLLKFNLSTLKFDIEVFKRAISIGLPSGIQQTLVALSGVILMSMVNSYGSTTMAAFTAAGRIDSFISMPAMNFSAALSAFVGQNIILRYYDRINRALKSTLIMSSVICLLLVTIIILFGDDIVNMFVKRSETNREEIIQIGHEYLLIVCSFYIFFSIMFVINGLLRGAGATLIPMFITLLSLWIIRIPLATILSKSFEMGANGIWWSIPGGWVIGCLGALIYYLTGKWKPKADNFIK